MRGDDPPAELHRQAQAQHADRLLATVGNTGIGLIQRLENAPRTLIVTGAGFGQADLASRAVEQRGAQRRFQRINQARYRRSGQPKPARSGRKALSIDSGHEHLHRLEFVHLLPVIQISERSYKQPGGSRSALQGICVHSGNTPSKRGFP
jgi:hypothetical protein